MPTYVYECSRCNQQFEAQQRITEDPLDTCVCGSKGTIKRLIQPIAVVFKGAGFHINDYAAKPAAPEGDGAEKTPPSETKSDSKTDQTATTETSTPVTPTPESPSKV